MTQEQFERLKEYEKEIMNAYKNNYVHMPGTRFNEVAKLYAEITGTELTKRQMGCNTCRLNALRKLGELYSNYTEPKKTKNNKRGRPEKLNGEGTTNTPGTQSDNNND